MRAISKINLFLEILNKRNDGYHEIRTVFYPINFLFDDIEIDEIDNGIVIESDNRDLPLDKDNLCWKAAAKFAKESGIEPHWRIRIKKRIPVSAGLGGGSSDAATVLKILSGRHPDSCDIRKIAKKLGADVSYFLDPVIALGEGVGERLTRLNCRINLPLLIVNPLFPISASWAYSHYFAVSKVSFEAFYNALKDGDPAKIANKLRNDLAPALYEKFPLLEIIRDQLFEYGALGVEISGSGSSLFAIFADEDKTREAAEKMRCRFNRGDNGKMAVKLFTP